MKSRVVAGFLLVLSLPTVALCQTAPQPIVRFHTNVGDIDVQLLPNSAPNTVANFLAYMNAGSYNNSVIHRSVPGFVWQGGGFQLTNGSLVAIPAKAPVANEFGVSNTLGTLAMALTGTDINSATTQWFFNEVDNSSTLDAQFFTVFGRIDSADTASLNVLQSVATVPVPGTTPGSPAAPLASPFNQIPLLNYTGGPVTAANYVIVESITQLNPYPAVLPAGVITASAFGRYPAAGPGSIIEIYGSNLAATTRGWKASDFNGLNAPTSLDGVTVTINGQNAYVSYVSPSQVNVQVPANIPTFAQVPVVVTYNNESSTPVTLATRPYEGALWAPPMNIIGNKQYAGATLADGTIAGIPAAPAVPGETLVFYGVGFGPVKGGTPVAGQIAQGQTSLSTTPFQFMIGQSQATVKYAGLAPGYVGLYQFNVVVPTTAPTGDLPLTITVGEQTVPQTLYLSVKAN